MKHEEEILLDPFVREHLGPHGAFVLRTNREHLARAKKACEQRRDSQGDRYVKEQHPVPSLRS